MPLSGGHSLPEDLYSADAVREIDRYVIDQQGVIRHVFNNLLDGPAHVKEAETIVQQLANG